MRRPWYSTAWRRWERRASRTTNPECLTGICLSPRRSMTVGASEEVVKSLGLKKGIKLIALDLSGLMIFSSPQSHCP